MIKQFIYHRWHAHRILIQRLFNEGVWIFIGQISTVTGMLVLVRILTELMKPAEYGKLALGLTIAGLINQVVLGGITNGIGRFYSIAIEKGDLWGYLNAIQKLLGYATLVVLIIALFLTSTLLITSQFHWLWLTAAVLLFSVFSGYNSALNSLQNAARQRAIVALHGGLDAWLKIVLAVGVILWMGNSSIAVIIGYTLSSIIITISQVFFLRNLRNHQFLLKKTEKNEDWIWQIWQFSWPFSAWGIFTWAQMASDRWALELFTTSHEVGQYTVVFQLGYAPIGLLTGIIITLVGPILYQRSGTANDHTRNTTTHNITWTIALSSLSITLIAFIFTWFLHKRLFQVLVASNFQDGSYFLPWVVLAGGLFATGQILSLKLMSEIRSKSLLQVKIGTALFGFIVNILGAWLYGINGVITALVIFSAIYLIWMIILTSHVTMLDN